MTNESKDIAVAKKLDMSMGVFSSIGIYEDYRRMAADLSNSDLIPTAFQGKPANVLIAVNMANRMQADPFMIMQSMFIVHGRPSFSASFIAAVIEESGKFGPLVYEMCGTAGQDDYGCRITTTIKANGQAIQGTWVTIKMAKAEGWYGKNGSKWPNMPEQMLRYRAVSFFGRLYAGSILLGMQSKEELDDVMDVNPVTGQAPMTKADMADALTGEATVVKEEPAKADVSRETANKPAEEKPAATEKSKDTEKAKATETAAQEEKPATDDNPFTPEALIKSIELADSIDTVNEAISCMKGFNQADTKAVMKAASAKNKELAAARSK